MSNEEIVFGITIFFTLLTTSWSVRWATNSSIHVWEFFLKMVIPPFFVSGFVFGVSSLIILGKIPTPPYYCSCPICQEGRK